MKNVKVSIIMGIYNCADTLPQAIDSLMAQTYQNWELIMCDDGSTDDTLNIAQYYHDRSLDRIILLKNDHNRGLNYTLNHCLSHVSGEYIARMDGDDISLPMRLEKEVKFLDDHSEYAIVSCPMIYFDENGEWGKGTVIPFPEKKDFIRGTPFCHAPCMVRREAFKSVGGYSEDNRTLRAEDYYLWFCMYKNGYRGANLIECLYMMRDDEKACKRRTFQFALNESYVRYKGYSMLELPFWSYIYILRPIFVNLIPRELYYILHRKSRLTR